MILVSIYIGPYITQTTRAASDKPESLLPYSPSQVDRIWGMWGSYYKIPKAIFYLLKGDYNPKPSTLSCPFKAADLDPQALQWMEEIWCHLVNPNLNPAVFYPRSYSALGILSCERRSAL